MPEQTATFGQPVKRGTRHQPMVAYAETHPESRCLWLCLDYLSAQNAFQEVLSSNWKYQIADANSLQLRIRLKNGSHLYFVSMNDEMEIARLRGLDIDYVGMEKRIAAVLAAFYHVIFPRASACQAAFTSGDTPLSSPESFF